MIRWQKRAAMWKHGFESRCPIRRSVKMFQLFTMDQREIDRLAETAAAHVGGHVSHDACLAGTPSRFVSGSTSSGAHRKH